MLNQLILVGRLTKNPTINEEGGSKLAIITLAIQRSFKNSDGEYEADYVDCTLWNGIAENSIEYCHEGDIVGVKGRLQTKDNQLMVIAEKLTFLSTRKKED